MVRFFLGRFAIAIILCKSILKFHTFAVREQNKVPSDFPIFVYTVPIFDPAFYHFPLAEVSQRETSASSLLGELLHPVGELLPTLFSLTHNLTHTGRKAEKFIGHKTARDHLFPRQNRWKCQEISQKIFLHQLVRMRSPGGRFK